MTAVDPVERLCNRLMRADPGGVLGVYLIGSSAVGGLRPQSDIDVLVLTKRSLSRGERQDLVDFLLQVSGARATVAPGRPLEVTGLVLDDVVPWVYPPVCDFLYGEWLRDEFCAGALPERHRSPDLAVLVTTARQHATCLSGPHPRDLLVPVPMEDLHRAVHDSLDPLLTNLVGDERNVLLTLARMAVTVETDQILPKDHAAEQVRPSLREPYRSTLALAARAYVGEVVDDWSDRRTEARITADHLARRIRSRPLR
jgi:streptomycin 3"-adenylyltransferase